MKRFFTVVSRASIIWGSLVFGAVTGVAADAKGVASGKVDKRCFSVEGMTCTTCSITLKAAVNKLDGIETVKVLVAEKSAVVTFDSTKTSSDAILAKINSTGYTGATKECKKIKG